jgi:hypothetical protein
MKTIVIQIGNSDDKLSQKEWSDFVADVKTVLDRFEAKIHFFGGSPNWESWQNCAWVAEINESLCFGLKDHLIFLRKKYRQASIAWNMGNTEFV